ncbi:hypothetical protein ACSXC4_17265 (plasmid) [Clostridium perfringens]|jgi:hypothetical protein|uniref:hypothetical protein n=1 Tax=Clostridium TaxID=1485 RepID=UPI00096AC1AC|nr:MULTISPECIES: hypothetical protein [Clostridium]MDK7591425.1 hypothetical protein [Clostridium sp. UMB9555B]MDK7629746.1 hypothetical protein [Clostridium sp. UMB9555A]
MIDSLIVKSEIYKNKENELKKKEIEINELNEKLNEFKRALSLRDDEIKSLKSELNIAEDKLNRFKEFRNMIWIMAELKKFKNNFLVYSKLTKNEIMFHDKDKIYINKKFLEDNFFNSYQNMSFKDKLYLLKLLSLIEVSEENRFTKKVFVNGKYKRMIVFDRHILDFYYNICI